MLINGTNRTLRATKLFEILSAVLISISFACSDLYVQKRVTNLEKEGKTKEGGPTPVHERPEL